MKKRTIALFLSITMMANTVTLSNCYAESVTDTESMTDAESMTNTESLSGTESSADVIQYPDPSIKENLPDTQPSVAEDFYVSINYDFIKNNEIQDGEVEYSAFTIAAENEKTSLQELLSGDAGDDEKLKLASTYYKEYIDMDSRNSAGWNSLKPYVESIENAETAEELINVADTNAANWNVLGLFTYNVVQDMEDISHYVITLSVPELSLGDSAEYTEMTDTGKKYKEVFNEFDTKLLKKYGYSDNEAEKIIADAYSFEEKMASYIYEASDVNETYYNAYTEDELQELAGDFQIRDVLDSIGADSQKKYIITHPKFFAALEEICTDDNLSLMKSFMIINLLRFSSDYTDEEADNYAKEARSAVTGSPLTGSNEDNAYTYAQDLFRELMGELYASYFLTDEQINGVEEILDNIKTAFRERLADNTWMSEETRQAALEKFDAIETFVGYPEEDFYDYSKIKIDDSKDLFTNYMSIYNEEQEQLLAKAGEKLNKNTWGIADLSDVNAYYDFATNCIYVNPAIIQAPFYNKDNTDEENYGAIGAILGHEFTHAFDPQGAQYDKDGEQNNWWTDEDSATFAELTAEVAARYGQYATVDDHQVDGDFTLGETVADLGGLAITLDVLKAFEKDGKVVDYKAFFEANAKMWGTVITKEQALHNFTGDIHAPSCLRVNVNLAQYEEFYDTFDIKEGDPMYTAPEDRLSVW